MPMPPRPNPMQGAVFKAESLPPGARERMTGVSWRERCPVSLDDLALLTVTHLGFDGKPHQGLLVVHQAVAGELLAIFRSLYLKGYPIEKMRLIEDYGGSDEASMRDDNTSAFNCRPVTGGTAFSKHSYGLAIDINPLYNPYIRGNITLPPEGAAYVDRSLAVKGMIRANEICPREFLVRGWTWGGNWESRKDYQHFEKALP